MPLSYNGKNLSAKTFKVIMPRQQMVLEIQFRSVNYTLVNRIWQKFQAKNALLVAVFKTKSA